MKLKRWLSRGIVLAMVVALMVPMPVAAKSSKAGGKLVKSVEYYDVNSAGKWQLDSKTTYTYDKKKNPKEIKYTGYGSYWFGIPTSGGSSTYTAKYKYKGSTPKSMVLKDEAGFVSEKRAYKKGKVISVVNEDKIATENKDGTVDSRISTYTTFVSYSKSGLANGESYQYSSAVAHGKEGSTSAYSVNSAYAAVEKKGIPSLIVETSSYQDKDGTEEPSMTYTKFNAKGLAVESGYIEKATGKYVPEVAIAYTMKKGNVKEAVVYAMDEKGNIAPCKMIKVKYTNTKISKARYMNMVNSFVDGYVEDANENGGDAVHGYFDWY